MEKTYPIRSIRQLKQQKKKSFMKTKIGVSVLVIFICLSLVVSAAILQYFARIIMVVDVPPAIKVDGHDSTYLIHDNITENPAGQEFCFPHWIDNHAPTAVPLKLEYTFAQGSSTTGLNITYFDFTTNETHTDHGTQGGDPFDLITGYGHDLVIKERHDKNYTHYSFFDITMPRNITVNDNFTLTINTNTTNVIHINYINNDWQYQDTYMSGDMPSWITYGVDGQKNFVIGILDDKIGNNNTLNEDCGLAYSYALYVQLHTAGDPVIIRAPDNDFTQRTIGTETNIISMAPSELGHVFSICYTFSGGASGHYEVYTDVVLAP